MQKSVEEKLPDETDIIVRKIVDEGIDGIIGGWPCQDISSAGKGAGLEGKRSGLWRYLFRTIRLVGPKIAMLENVAALLYRGMAEVQGDLASIGYDTEWNCIPASSFGLAHRRTRTWIMAYAPGERRSGVLYRQLREREEQARIWQADALDTSRNFDARARGEIFGEPILFRGNDGRAKRVDRLKAIGNGNPPIVITELTKELK